MPRRISGRPCQSDIFDSATACQLPGPGHGVPCFIDDEPLTDGGALVRVRYRARKEPDLREDGVAGPRCPDPMAAPRAMAPPDSGTVAAKSRRRSGDFRPERLRSEAAPFRGGANPPRPGRFGPIGTGSRTTGRAGEARMSRAWDVVVVGKATRPPGPPVLDRRCGSRTAGYRFFPLSFRLPTLMKPHHGGFGLVAVRMRASSARFRDTTNSSRTSTPCR
jgi:hypothetical protein